LPKVFEQLLVADGVHALPEGVVPVGHELAVARQPLERLPLELRRVAVDVVEDLRLEHEERAVDPALADLRLLRELGDLVAVEIEVPVARGRPDRREGGQLAVRAMEREQPVEVDVRDTVAPREMNVSSPMQRCRRLIRPPVAVSWPVSIRFTVQSSGMFPLPFPFPLRVTVPSRRPIVRSECSDAYSTM
jgi:hypothetical protein